MAKQTMNKEGVTNFLAQLKKEFNEETGYLLDPNLVAEVAAKACRKRITDMLAEKFSRLHHQELIEILKQSCEESREIARKEQAEQKEAKLTVVPPSDGVDQSPAPTEPPPGLEPLKTTV